MLELAATLPGERDPLRAVVRDPMSRSTRAAYARWLDAHGDHRRAGFVRQLGIALHSMDRADLPDVGAVPGAWARSLGACSVAELLLEGRYRPASRLDRGQLGVAAARMLRLGRPTLNIAFSPASGPPAVGGSRLWGHPDLPDDVDWPRLDSALRPFEIDGPPESPCSFIGQIDLAGLADALIAPDLPSTGLLSFFCHVDEWNGALSPTVRYFPDTRSLRPRPPPSDLDEDNLGAPAHDLRFVEALAFPALRGPWRADLPTSGSDADVDEDVYYTMAEAGGASLHGLLGYFASTTGDDPTPDVTIRKLAVLRVTPELQNVHLGIPEHALREANFDAVTYDWYDWDQ